MRVSLRHGVFLLKQQHRINIRQHNKFSSSSDAGSKRSRWRWPVLSLPVGVGLTYIAYQQLGHVLQRNTDNTGAQSTIATAAEWKIALYKSLPLRIISRFVGKIAETELPTSIAPSIYRTFGKMYGVNMQEAKDENYANYRTFSEFFRRRLKDGARPIDTSVPMVCPSDGKVLHLGLIDSQDAQVEQVKDVTYSLKHFLGDYSGYNPASSKDNQADNQITGEKDNYAESLKHNPDNELYHCIIYLAPGDYHLYHSPVQWVVNSRTHFHGELLSVNPYIARKVPSLFALNERAVYYGKWQYGFFSMSPVGATNVGSIRVYHDPDLVTNVSAPATQTNAQTMVHFKQSPLANNAVTQTMGGLSPISDSQMSNEFKRGSMFGEFSLGSTIVLIFEAPKDFKFKVQAGDIVKYGQALGEIKSEKKN